MHNIKHFSCTLVFNLLCLLSNQSRQSFHSSQIQNLIKLVIALFLLHFYIPCLNGTTLINKTTHVLTSFSPRSVYKKMQRSNTTSACASCKHQRKKCTEKCTLAPFFPVERTREFQAVHKVFGVSNVTKIITSLREEDRNVAVDSLVWEALSRQKDPILGPFGDYRRVCEELRLYKSQYQHFHQIANQGSIVYKASGTQGIMGWNNNSNKIVNPNINNNNNTNINNNSFLGNGNSVVDYCSYGYSPNHHVHQDSEKQRAERENGTAIILPQQHIPNAYSQQFILAGNMYVLIVNGRKY